MCNKLARKVQETSQNQGKKKKKRIENIDKIKDNS